MSTQIGNLLEREYFILSKNSFWSLGTAGCVTILLVNKSVNELEPGNLCRSVVNLIKAL